MMSIDWEEKVRKLLAKAERAGTAEEAEAFAAKAQELMTKHAIDELRLRAGGELKARVVTVEVPLPGNDFRADMMLLSSLADANDCRTVWQQPGVPRSRWPGKVWVTGYEDDVAGVRLLYAALRTELNRITRGAEDPTGWSTPHVYRQTFRIAFAVAVKTRLTKVQEDAIRSAESDLLPVLVGKRADVDAAFEAEFPHVSSGKSKGVQWSGAGAAAGRAAGQRADVGHTRLGGKKELGA